MKRLFLARILSVCVCISFCCTACQKHDTNSLQAPSSADAPSAVQPTAPTAPAPTSPTAPTPSEVWDIRDIPNDYVCAGKKYIAFTFDDAPASTLDAIIGVFLSYNQTHPDCQATASLFCNGVRMNTYSVQTLQTAHLIGFEMGNHTHSHADLTKLSADELQTEIDRTDRLLQKIDDKSRHLLRAPFGCLNETVRAVASTPIISWTIDTKDWTGIAADSIYQSVWENRFDGAIVLMHDGYEHTVQALERLLPDLYADGYQVLSVSALSKANACPLKTGNVYIRARKNGSAR